MSEPTVISDELGIKLFHMTAQYHAVKLEGLGIGHSSGRSVLAHVKRTYGLKGNREKVLEEFHELILELEAKRAAI